MQKIFLRYKQVFLFIVAGALSAFIEISFFKIFSLFLPKIISFEENLFGIKYPFSNVFSTLCAIIFNYWLSIKFVFKRGKHSKTKELTYFILISIISTILSLTFFQILYNYIILKNFDAFGIFTFSNLIMSKALAISIVAVLNYIIKKRIIFNG